MNYFKSIKLLIIFAIICLLSTALLGQERSDELHIEPYVFENSAKEKVTAELGELTVPENRNDGHSRLIKIAFVRFKSTSPNPGSPLIYLAGGPGGSGIEAAQGNRFSLFMAMREFGDVIALDQRGTGLSTPNLACQSKTALPLDEVLTNRKLNAFASRELKKCAAEWISQGGNLTGYNTNENADDIESLRQALGAKKISLWSISYGTTLALTIIKRHEQKIDRAILAGVEGLDDALKLPSDSQQNLIDIAHLVKNDPTLNREIPDFLGLMKTVLERLEKHPVTVEIQDPQTNRKLQVVINKYAMQLVTVSTLGSSSITHLPRLYDSALNGDFSEIAMRLKTISEYIGSGSVMSYMTDCSNGASPQRFKKIREEAKTALLGNTANTEFPEVCRAWGNPDLGSSFRLPVKSDIPVLFISGTLDGLTPFSNAEAVQKGFPHSTHLIIEGAWHSDSLFLSSPRIRDVILEFMRGIPVSTTRIKLPTLKFAPLKSRD